MLEKNLCDVCYRDILEASMHCQFEATDFGGEQPNPGNPNQRRIFWVAVKALNLRYYDMGIYQIVWLLDCGNLN